MENEKTKCAICDEEINVSDKVCPHCDSAVETENQKGNSEEFEFKSESVKATESENNSNGKVELWSPNAAANWSFLFSMIFGAFIHARNWKALNKEDEAKKSMYWLYGGVMAIILLELLPESSFDYVLMVGPLLAWYFIQAKKQVRYIKDNKIDYKPKSWGKPIIIGIAAMIIFVGISVIFAGNSELEASAKPLVNEIIVENFGSGRAKCVDIEITEELQSGLYKARAYLDNGESLVITIQERGNDQIYVSIPTNQ